ncbi:MAG: LPXTG cell wall anchor domain-containing protein [Streptococcaceae bacterium]|jgi:LPXTG-motif cell wall-anchored protein|nr:LPXTG cell wall anchor domain-containing protein [Streptococcaceae bacterium]
MTLKRTIVLTLLTVLGALALLVRVQNTSADAIINLEPDIKISDSPYNIEVQIVDKLSYNGAGVDGVSYTLYDATQAVSDFRASSKTAFKSEQLLFEEFTKRVALGTLDLATLDKLDTKVTSGGGIASFYGDGLVFNRSILSNSVIHRIYLIAQTATPTAYRGTAAPIMFSVPLKYDDLTEMGDHYGLRYEVKGSVEPPTISYFYKYGKKTIKSSDASGVAIGGAEFTISDEAENGRLYFTESGTWSSNPVDAKLFISSKVDGLVDLTSSGLDPGVYRVEEVKAPAGYDINEASQNIQLILPDDLKSPAIVNGVDVTDSVEVLNIRTPEPDVPPTPDVPTPSTQEQGILPTTGGLKLPTTGEAISYLLTIIGSVLITLFVLRVKRTR